MPDGVINEEEKSIRFPGENERGISMRVDCGKWDTPDDWYPEVEIAPSWAGSERSESCKLVMRLAPARVNKNSHSVNASKASIIGDSTVEMSLPETGVLQMDIVLIKAQVAHFQANGSVVIPFDISDSTGLVFTHQGYIGNPVINGDEVSGTFDGQSATRKIWDDGAIAVYHQSLRNDRYDGFGGSILAGTGKLCTIRRPFVTDLDSGDVFWGDMEIVDGELRMIFSTTWFAQHLGPFVIDQDVGNTGVGGSSGNNPNSQYAAGYFVMPEDGDITHVAVYAGTAVELTTGLWLDNASTNPTTLLGDSAGATPSAGSWSIQALDSSVSRTTGQQVWSGFNSGGASGVQYKYDASSGGENDYLRFQSSLTYSTGTLVDYSGGSTFNRTMSSYFTYTATGGAFAGIHNKIIGGGVV